MYVTRNELTQLLIPARRECEPVTSEVCKTHGFDSAVFPNILNVTNELEAKQRVDTLIQLFQEDRLVSLTNVCKSLEEYAACFHTYHRCNSTTKGYAILPCLDYCQGEFSRFLDLFQNCVLFLRLKGICTRSYY